MFERRRYAADFVPQNRHQAGKAVQPHSRDEANMARPRGVEKHNHRQDRQAPSMRTVCACYTPHTGLFIILLAPI